jgi:hypothetical protein
MQFYIILPEFEHNEKVVEELYTLAKLNEKQNRLYLNIINLYETLIKYWQVNGIYFFCIIMLHENKIVSLNLIKEKTNFKHLSNFNINIESFPPEVTQNFDLSVEFALKLSLNEISTHKYRPYFILIKYFFFK